MVSTRSALGDAVVSGACWSVASIAVFLAAVAGVDRSTPATVVAALALGWLTLGLPLHASAERTGGRRPRLEAAAWTLLAALATVVFFAAIRPESSPVNAVTLGRGASAVSPYWPYPPELVWGVRCLALFAGAAGLASAVFNSGTVHVISVVWRGVAFGACVAVALFASLVAFAIGGPLLWAVLAMPSLGVVAAAFVSGCTASAGISGARVLLIKPLSDT